MASRTNIAPQLVSALGHHRRKEILEALEAGPLTLPALADKLNVHRQTVGRHAEELRRVGVIRSRNTSGGRVMYLATPMPERAMDREWARIPRQARQRAVATALARMQTATSSALVDGGFDRDSIHLSRTRLNISESAWAELSKRYLEWLEFIEALQQEAAESEEGMVDATAILMLFEAQATGPEASIQHPDAALPAEPKLKTQSMNLCEEVHGMLANPVTDWAGVVGHADELAALGKAGMAAQERKQS